MPEKPLGVERGLFRTFGRQADDEEAATELGRAAQQVEDPRTGAVFLSIVNRLSTLEAAARGERLLRLGAEAQQEVLVLDNEAAQELIEELKDKVAATVAEQTNIARELDQLLSVAREVILGFEHGNTAQELASFPEPFPRVYRSLIALQRFLAAAAPPAAG